MKYVHLHAPLGYLADRLMDTVLGISLVRDTEEATTSNDHLLRLERELAQLRARLEDIRTGSHG